MDQPQSDNNMRKTEKGFVTLLFVLVVFAVGISVSSSLLLMGVASSRNSFALNQSNQAKALADACAERGLETVRDDNSYTGTINLDLGQGSCSYTISNTGGSNRTIIAMGTVSTIVRKVRVIINQIAPQINVSSWQEVADF